MEIINLGKDGQIRKDDEGYEINVANNWLVKIKNNGKDFSYENIIREKEAISAGDKIKYIDMVDQNVRKLVRAWSYNAELYSDAGFARLLREAVVEIEEDFWIVDTCSLEDREIVMEVAKKDLVSYEVKFTTREECTFWLAYKIARGERNYKKLYNNHFEELNTIFTLKKIV